MHLIPFFTIFLLAPIPVLHIFLHAFLGGWKKYPLGLYLTGAVLWVVSYFVAGALQPMNEQLFLPSMALIGLAEIIAFLGLLLIIWSFITIGPKRFLLWAVVKPEAVEQKYIKTGPFRLMPHPAYVGYLMAATAAVLATGKVVLFVFFVYSLVLLFIVILLENHEIKNRLGIDPDKLGGMK